ncbi:MAG: response regulator [Phycisphaeraceae bacterium]|nr:response regulator [Phycisphaeraceae bacterium]
MSPIRVDSHLDSILVADFEPDEERTDEIALVFGRFCDAIGRRFEREELGRERESFATIRGSLERSEILLQLAGGLRHDFNNVAFAIGGRISLLLQRTGDPVTAKGLEEIRNAVDAARHLIDRFVPDAAGADRTLRIPIRVELEEIANTAKRLIPRRLDLRFECDRSAIDDGVVLEAPPETLQRMLLNLVVNSRDAIRGRGRIRISATRLDADRIEIRVDDDGPGIPPSDRARLLEPFESGPGSTGPGVGLSLCRRSANRLGGLFELTSSPLGGLGARLVLPVCVESPGRLDETPAAAVGDARMPRTTLVVEDNAAVRDVITSHLEQAGTSVTKASDAVGVEEYLAADHDIEMLVMDIDLPRRSGIDCISALRAAGDRTPCVLITGGIADPPPLERTKLLRKPFEMGPLVSTIRDLLADCESATADAGRRTG